MTVKVLLFAAAREQIGQQEIRLQLEPDARIADLRERLAETFPEIRELLSIKADPDTGSREIRTLAQSRLGDIEEKIKLLQRMRKTLKELVESCPGEGPKTDCPILEAPERDQAGE